MGGNRCATLIVKHTRFRTLRRLLPQSSDPLPHPSRTCRPYVRDLHRRPFV